MPGARALWLEEDVPVVRPELIAAGREFAHIHPDGSLHVALPPARAKEAVEASWAEPHPIVCMMGMDGMVMLYTPRSTEELDVIFELIVDSYNFVTGRAEDAQRYRGRPDGAADSSTHAAGPRAPSRSPTSTAPSDSTVRCWASNFTAARADLVVLTERPGARRVGGRSGLYHFAVLVPSRLELAQILRRIAETRTPVEGIVDHWISEAIYLPDPDGNGIEVACDRPREQWPSLETLAIRGTGPLDIDGLFNELARADGAWMGLGPRTVIGHVHLHVASISEAEAF